MAISDTTIANMALRLAGAAPIGGMTDGSAEADVLKIFYEQARNRVFDLGVDWHFATARAQLSQLATTPAFGWDYQYGFPAGCRRIVRVVDEYGDNVHYPWRRGLYIDTTPSPPREYHVLLTNETTVYVKYIHLIVDPAMWPAWFTHLVTLNIAWMICEPLKQSKEKKLDLQRDFELARNDAESANDKDWAEITDQNTQTDFGNNDVLDASDPVTGEGERYIVNL